MSLERINVDYHKAKKVTKIETYITIFTLIFTGALLIFNILR